jgi:hypothetical protein
MGKKPVVRRAYVVWTLAVLVGSTGCCCDGPQTVRQPSGVPLAKTTKPGDGSAVVNNGQGAGWTQPPKNSALGVQPGGTVATTQPGTPPATTPLASDRSGWNVVPGGPGPGNLGGLTQTGGVVPPMPDPQPPLPATTVQSRSPLTPAPGGTPFATEDSRIQQQVLPPLGQPATDPARDFLNRGTPVQPQPLSPTVATPAPIAPLAPIEPPPAPPGGRPIPPPIPGS